MNISEKGLTLIKAFEGCRLAAYKCVPTEKYYTIGYGHYGPDVKADDIITELHAEYLLKKDIEKFVDSVNKVMTRYGYNLNQNQFDALVSFTYNCGESNLVRLTNSGKRNLKEISDAILFYNKSGGKVLSGLVRRRKAEQALFEEVITCN